jgi:hypothetical protein
MSACACPKTKPVSEMDARERCLLINDLMPRGGLYTEGQRPIHERSNAPWRISPEPFWMPRPVLDHIEALGRHLLKFYRACNLLYSQSVRGVQPVWIADYLDQGKPESVVAYGRMNRFKQHLPHVIRPDLIPIKGAMIATELDSVPGGIGFTASLAQHYGKLDYPIVGGADGMIAGFADMVRSAAGQEDPALGIVVSEESSNYRPEMDWLGGELNRIGLRTAVVGPEEVAFSEDGLRVDLDGAPTRIDVLYRFFELFDLKNIPKAELMLYAAKKGTVFMTPPAKACLEEKLWMALFHHPVIEKFWITELGEETFISLKATFPKTWVLDPRPLPPHALIPNLEVHGYPIAGWDALHRLTQKERTLVVKPSGFSDMAAGSKGVSIGHDMSEEDWRAVLKNALNSFETTPHILQEFHKGAQFNADYYDFDADAVRRLSGRVRLCPYYYVIHGEARLSGILATVCPPDKKLLHGMVDAIMIPCGIKS